MRDGGTPAEVEVTSEPREPVWDPTLGIDVHLEVGGTPRHRLVAIGDSLTMGLQSGSIFNVGLSYPAIIAYELGWAEQFRHPEYPGYGGLPLNIEFVIRELEAEFGEKLNWWELPLALFRVRHLMDVIEDWWERGGGSQVPRRRGINHNLAVFGWDLRDTLERNADICRAEIKEAKDELVNQKVENATARAALRVLDSARDAHGKVLTAPQAAAALGKEGVEGSPAGVEGAGDGIETLIVFLGSNNALSAVTELKVVWSEAGFDDLRKKRRFTVWRPSHFAGEFDKLTKDIRKIRARHVIWATVPHVTIAPIARGVGGKVRPGSRYFPYYTRPWISDREFDAKNDPHITEQQARGIDSSIDQYNSHIAMRVIQARKEGRDWYLLDVAGVLDRLACRRYIDDPGARPAWWRPYELPAELRALSPVPDSRFFASGPGGRTAGGWFSLDGTHPTTIGYGILAQEFATVMEKARVTFHFRDGRTPRDGPVKIDFSRLAAADTLISHPPRSVSSDLALIGWLDNTLDVFRRVLRLGT